MSQKADTSRRERRSDGTQIQPNKLKGKRGVNWNVGAMLQKMENELYQLKMNEGNLDRTQTTLKHQNSVRHGS